MESSTTFASSVSPLLSETEMRAFLDAATCSNAGQNRTYGKIGGQACQAAASAAYMYLC